MFDTATDAVTDDDDIIGGDEDAVFGVRLARAALLDLAVHLGVGGAAGAGGYDDNTAAGVRFLEARTYYQPTIRPALTGYQRERRVQLVVRASNAQHLHQVVVVLLAGVAGLLELDDFLGLLRRRRSAVVAVRRGVTLRRFVLDRRNGGLERLDLLILAITALLLLKRAGVQAGERRQDFRVMEREELDFVFLTIHSVVDAALLAPALLRKLPQLADVEFGLHVSTGAHGG